MVNFLCPPAVLWQSIVPLSVHLLSVEILIPKMSDTSFELRYFMPDCNINTDKS